MDSVVHPLLHLCYEYRILLLYTVCYIQLWYGRHCRRHRYHRCSVCKTGSLFFGGGIIADKLGRSKVMYVTFAMMAIGTFLMVIMNNMSSTLFIALCIMIYAGMYGGYSLVFSMMEEGGVPIRVAGTAIGLVCTVGYLPEVIVPFCSGKILDTFGDGGYRYMFIAIAVIMVVGIVMLTVWDRYVKKVKARQAAEENAAA